MSNEITSEEVRDIVVCRKHDMLLEKKKGADIFYLRFSSQNKGLKIKNVINFKLYDLIATLNKDVVERAEIGNEVPGKSIDVLFVFKPFGTELGIAQKYMFFRTLIEESADKIIMTSKSMQYPGGIAKCEPIVSNYAQLTVFERGSSTVDVGYIFHMEMTDDLPTYMENIAGLLMKKMFFRVKQFIENIK